MIPLVSRIPWTEVMAGALTYQLGAIRFGWARISKLWPWNAVLFLGLVAHFLDEYLNDAFDPRRDF